MSGLTPSLPATDPAAFSLSDVRANAVEAAWPRLASASHRGSNHGDARATDRAIAEVGSPGTPRQLDVAEGVDPGVEEAADHGRGLVLDDDRWAGDDRTRRERGALVDRHLDEIRAVGVEHRAAARRRRVRGRR